MANPDDCDHGVKFDETVAKEMCKNGATSYDIRRAFPRGFGKCEKCGLEGIFYASYLHYLMGDW